MSVVVPFRRPTSAAASPSKPRKAARLPAAHQSVALDCDMMQDGDHDPYEFGTAGEIAGALAACLCGLGLAIGLIVKALWP